ncbi:MAG: hypothetical protein IPH61_15480 [Bacteroidetes bacterium]|nr:hypothetical protein [Bacteroidota bacterium]
MKNEFELIQLFKQFISDSETGKRLKKDGSKIRKGTIDQYKVVLGETIRFQEKEGIRLRIFSLIRSNKRVLKSERLYWNRFYKKIFNSSLFFRLF